MKTKNRFELDPERLATTDQDGHRIYLYPEDVKGFWKKRQKLLYWPLIILYLLLPWFNINHRPALMLNIFTREFAFLGFIFHGVEPIIIFLIVASGLFFIAFLTSIFGRVWCGWACPQTVFIHTLFLKIEQLIEGNARSRRELDDSPMSLSKFFKKFLKWLLFCLISLHIAHTFFGYFVGPRVILQMSLHNPTENIGLFIAVIFLSSILLLDFGWFREQFCIIACPYGRMQSVIMDSNSLVVAYDQHRGEPRRGSADNEGDCINCYACVKVCPTGIDIRRGTQLECIACTNCIDACDEIMTKLDRPQGLIRYSSENEMSGKKQSKLTTRSLIYLLIFLSLITSLSWFFLRSTKLDFVLMRGNNPYQVITTNNTPTILNNFTLKISHQGNTEHELSLEAIHPALREKITIIIPSKLIKINGPEFKTILMFKFDPSILINGTRTFTMAVKEQSKTIQTEEVTLVGPTK